MRSAITRALLALFAVASTAAAAHGQASSDDARSRAKEERAAQALRLEAGLARIAFLEGDWGAELSVSDGRGGWKSVATERIDMKRSVGGKALVSDFSFAGYRFVMYVTFDAVRQVYRVSSIDDVTGVLDVFEGDFDDEGGLVVTNVRVDTSYRQLGVTYHTRLRFVPNGGRWAELQVDVSSDGGASWRGQTKASIVEAR